MKIEINNSVVTNDGDEIGIIQDSTCHLTVKVGPTVKGAIRKESGITDLQFIVGDSPDEGDGYGRDEVKTSLADMSDDELAAEMKRRGLIREAPPVVESAAIIQPHVKPVDLSAVDRLNKLADEGKIPKPPAKHPAMGDKTPDYVAWFKAHATPEEIATRYPENRRIPASVREFQQAAEKLQGKLPGEKKDTNKENDFTGEGDA